MLSSVYSAGLAGIDGYIVTVESDAKDRLPCFELVGLPDLAVKEAKERVRAACENSGFLFPALAMTVNLAPADRKKEGSAFDAAILAALLASAGLITADFSEKCIVGELSLSGELRPVPQLDLRIRECVRLGYTHIVLPSRAKTHETGFEALRVPDLAAAIRLGLKLE